MLPSREKASPEAKDDDESWFTGGDPERKPAGADGGSFFDPGKLEADTPSGGVLQIRGFVALNFITTMRTDTTRRNASGEFVKLDPLAYFDVPSATLYFGAPVYADVVYARVGLEFVSIPTQQDTGGNFDIIAQARRSLFVESAALEINPFAWAKKADPWFRYGFKLTGGVFIVPFGLEDESHAAPVNWFVTRPRSMTSNRVYPGTWSDVGLMLTWKPTFSAGSPIRPIQIDVGMINGDPCTHTRFIDQLFLPPGFSPATCERRLRPGEVEGASAEAAGVSKIDAGFFGIAADNNANKSVVARLQIFPIGALNLGGSFVWGKHPEGARIPESGQTTIELEQAPSWRAGGHLELDLAAAIESSFPPPHVRGEVVYGVDDAVDRVDPEFTRRRMLGGYVQVQQILFQRKKTRLPGLIVQYRFDHADPDLDVPSLSNGVPVNSDFSNALYPRESTIQSHTFGVRFPVLPRFTLKGEYSLVREDGGRTNQLYNDVFALEIVADF